MKKISLNIIKLMICLLPVAVSIASCKKLITIPENPPSSITKQQQFADSTTAITAVAGVYMYYTANGFAYSDADLTTSCGLSSDELSYTNIDDNQQFYNYTLTPLNNRIINLWSYPYQSVFQVNSVLEGVNGSSTLPDSFKKQITGEMKVVRALYYFNLINLFGDVPLVTTTNYLATDHIPRTPAADVYKQVINDLTDARNKLNAAYPSAGHARPNLYTATALLAKVNLYKSNWQSAYSEADSVIRLGGYSLATNLNEVFLNASTEALWQIPANQGFYGVADAQFFLPAYPGAPLNYLFTTPLVNTFESGDKRLQNWVATATVNGNTVHYPHKYKNLQASVTPTEDKMILRLAEVYLIRAEAAAHLNNLAQALADVNTIRARAGLAASTAGADQVSVLAAIAHERQTELFCEWGNRWFDLKRTGTAATVLNAVKTGFTAKAALYPVPQSQILLNNLLTQNQGY
jgi:hypothetical protein